MWGYVIDKESAFQWGTSFALVAAEHGSIWRRAADAFGKTSGIPLSVIDVSEQGEYIPDEPKFTRLYRLDKGCGMVLVRPDGFVARSAGG
jgi:hypothetical protein